jgi:RecA-family ATPase
LKVTKENMSKAVSLPAAEDASMRPFKVLSPADMYQMPEDRTDWLVNGLLPSIGTSLVGASPKCGKSVITRQLCAFISQGRPFLGREVRQGKALYVSTQEQPAKIADHFRDLGCDAETMPLTIASEPIDPRSAIQRLSTTISRFPGLRLVVVDMVVDVLQLRDSNDYIEMNKAFGSLRQLAQEHSLHVCVTHHVKKAQTENAAHSFIGSSAIAGSVDQLIRLDTDSRGQRSIDTLQRYGEAIPHTLLNWNGQQRALYLGQGMEEARQQQKEATSERIIKDIITWVEQNPGRTRDEILSAVTGKTTARREAFNRILTEGHLIRSGSGAKGDPQTYTLAEWPTNTTAQAA